MREREARREDCCAEIVFASWEGVVGRSRLWPAKERDGVRGVRGMRDDRPDEACGSASDL